MYPCGSTVTITLPATARRRLQDHSKIVARPVAAIGMLSDLGLSRHHSVAPGNSRRRSALSHTRLAPTAHAISLAPTQRTKAPLAMIAVSMANVLATAGTRSGGTLAGVACAGFGQYGSPETGRKVIAAAAATTATNANAVGIVEPSIGPTRRFRKWKGGGERRPLLIRSWSFTNTPSCCRMCRTSSTCRCAPG
jgi:hypothetical protein